MSPSTLRKFFIRKRGGNIRHQAAHQVPKAQAETAQAQPPQANKKYKGDTESTATSNRHDLIKLTKFKKGFEEDTERELAQAFNRPPRTYKEDTPFYPWTSYLPKSMFLLKLQKLRPTLVHLVVYV